MRRYAKRITAQLVDQETELSDRLASLTAQERECLRLVNRHLSSKEIGRELGIAKASVDTYCNRARAKLGVRDRYAAARLLHAYEQDLGAPVSLAAAAPLIAEPSAPAREATPQPARREPSRHFIESIGPLGRIGIIIAGAVLIALAFGMLLSGMQTLENFAYAMTHSGAARPREIPAVMPANPPPEGRPAKPGR